MKILKKIFGYFLKGLLVIVPLVVTVYIVYFLFAKIDGLIKLDINGFGFAIIIVGITTIGFFASSPGILP